MIEEAEAAIIEALAIVGAKESELLAMMPEAQAA